MLRSIVNETQLEQKVSHQHSAQRGTAQWDLALDWSSTAQAKEHLKKKHT